MPLGTGIVRQIQQGLCQPPLSFWKKPAMAHLFPERNSPFCQRNSSSRPSAPSLKATDIPHVARGLCLVCPIADPSGEIGSFTKPLPGYVQVSRKPSSPADIERCVEEIDKVACAGQQVMGLLG